MEQRTTHLQQIKAMQARISNQRRELHHLQIHRHTVAYLQRQVEEKRHHIELLEREAERSNVGHELARLSPTLTEAGRQMERLAISTWLHQHGHNAIANAIAIGEHATD